ncbi:hypothetical protein PIB30_060827 [Stylosanthes scabra]|uniref:Putative plant transposon protein domain-containing protein n=1 Tax=Stylosanthes scabra TaxID=79078 RepID=A0ABU6SLT5_9FABA|nr:hypothetical protein [Stylosanthes scabra]
MTNPRTKISNLLIQEFYVNAVRTEEEIAEAEAHPYKSYVMGVEIDFSAENIRQILRIRDNTPGAESNFDTRQRSDQRLDEVIQEICVPRARWKMSSSQPHQPIQLKRQDLIPLARGWHEFIIDSSIPTGNKLEIIVARAILIHSIIKEDDVKAEELIPNNIAITVEQPQGRSKLAFPSTIHRICKAAEVPSREFRRTELIFVDKPITARLMEHEQPYMHYEAPDAGFQNNFGEQQQQGFQQINEELSNMKIQQEKFFENMQNTQAQYLEDLKALKTRDPINKLKMKMDNQHKEITDMRSQIKEWTKNASSREAYCCWAHQQANLNLVQIPLHDIPKFFHGAVKTHEQGEPSQSTDVPMAKPEKE